MNSRQSELSGSVLEFIKIVSTANTNFTNLDKVLKSISQHNLIDDPNKWGEYEYRTHLGRVFNLFKAYALNKDTMELFVKALTKWLPLVDIFSKQVTVATKDLTKDSDFASIKHALKMLTHANRPEQDANLLVVYLSEFENVFNFVDSWNKLDPSVRKIIYDHCKAKLNLKEMEVDTLFLFPFQHISRLQLHLKVMAEKLAKYPEDAELSVLATRFDETSKALQEKINEFNSIVKGELDKGFVIV